MAVYAIGDIHGRCSSLKALINHVDIKEDDTLVLLGDYVDRGADSKGVLDFIIELRESLDVKTLRGNHEIMMQEARLSSDKFFFWQKYGGMETLESYGYPFDGSPWVDYIPEEHWAFMKFTIPWYETENSIFVHGSLNSEKDMSEQTPLMLYWERFHRIKPHKSGKRIFCGHTHQISGNILTNGYAYCIDTAKHLTCIDTDTLQFWQANEEGNCQSGQLQ